MHDYLKPLVMIYRNNRNEKLALPMAKYMKNKFPFLGIKTPERKKLFKDFIAENGYPTQENLNEIVLQLWELPEREFQYTAQGILVRFVKKLSLETIDLIENLLIRKSWWDTVDLLSSKIVGPHFTRYPQLRESFVTKWMHSKNIWLQRTCLLFQLNYKDRTDFQLLFSLIKELNGSKEFFINKAIGWILREYSKTDAESVIDFVESQKLAPLSRREAYKWLKKNNKI